MEEGADENEIESFRAKRENAVVDLQEKLNVAIDNLNTENLRAEAMYDDELNTLRIRLRRGEEVVWTSEDDDWSAESDQGKTAEDFVESIKERALEN